jgi:hypothetical protein
MRQQPSRTTDRHASTRLKINGWIMMLGRKHTIMSRTILGQEKSAGPKEKVTIGVGPGGLSLPHLLIGVCLED